MHILDSYALNCGAKIDKPYIYEQYYPLGEDNYITLQPQSRFAGKEYDYWNDVIDYIHPYLEKKNIKIVQMGARTDRALKKSIWTQGTTTLNQVAFLLRHSLLHVGIDSFAVHIASGLAKKTVSLHSTNWARNSSPYWSSPDDYIALEPDRTKRKPSFQFEDDPPKSINEIKPEKVASSVLSLMGIEHEIPHETLYVGESYNNINFSIVPSESLSILDPQIKHVIIRMDLGFNEDILVNQLQKLPCSIVTDKPISPIIIKELGGNIKDLVYKIDENHNVDFVSALHRTGMNYVLFSTLEDEKLNKIKLDYLDYNFIFKKTPYEEKREKILKHPIDKLLFKSNKKILKDGKVYNSVANLSNGVSEEGLIDYPFHPLLDNEAFWEDLEDFRIVKRLD